MNEAEQKAKWNRIHSQTERGNPCSLLSDHGFLLPEKGVALDLACGLGANAHFLHQQGLTVHAWDLSDIAIQQLSTFNPDIHSRVINIEQTPLPTQHFDVIVVSYFLLRTLCPAISTALKPGGLLFYQTYCLDKLTEKGPSNPEYLLKNNELIALFPHMQILFYQEFSRLGNLIQGDRNTAGLIAKQP